MSGWLCVKSQSRGMKTSLAKNGCTEILNALRVADTRCRAATSSRRVISGLMSSSSECPASVRINARRVRSNSFCPSSSSRFFIWWLTAEAVMNSFSAASRKLSCSAAKQKALSPRSEIFRLIGVMALHVNARYVPHQQTERCPRWVCNLLILNMNKRQCAALGCAARTMIVQLYAGGAHISSAQCHGAPVALQECVVRPAGVRRRRPSSGSRSRLQAPEHRLRYGRRRMGAARRRYPSQPWLPQACRAIRRGACR